MTDKKSSSKIFFGWWTVIYTGLLSGFGFGFSSYGLSVFFKDIAAELNLSRAMTSLASGLGGLTGGPLSVLTGWLADKLGPKWIIFTGVCIGAIGMAAMYFVHTPLSFILTWGLVMLPGIYFGLTIAVEQSLTSWFVKKRGLAQGIKFALIGVSTSAVLPTITWLSTSVGWRLTCVIWAGYFLLLGPLALIFVKQHRPEHYGLLPDGAKADPSANTGQMAAQSAAYARDAQETEFTFRQALRTRAFWLIALGNGIFTLAGWGFNTHIIPFLTDQGIEKATASALTSMMVFVAIPMRFFAGALSDRVGKGSLRFMLAVIMGLPVIGVSAFLLNPGMSTVYALLIFFGMSAGVGVTVIILMLGRYYGRKAFGSIFGLCNGIQSLAMFVTPSYYGWVYDTTHSYNLALTIFTVVAVVCVFAVCLARPPKPAAVD